MVSCLIFPVAVKEGNTMANARHIAEVEMFRGSEIGGGQYTGFSQDIYIQL